MAMGSTWAFAYALQALIEQGGASGAPAEDETDAAPAAEETDAADSSTEETAADEGTDIVGAPVSQDDNEEEE